MLSKKREKKEQAEELLDTAQVVKRTIFSWKSTLRAISLVLIFSLMMSMLPMIAVAVEDFVSEPNFLIDPDNQVVDIFGETSEKELMEDLLADENILGEALELREEYVKHFRLADGRMIAATYELPVHELDEDDNWVDINNDLVPCEDDSFLGEDGGSVKEIEPDPLPETDDTDTSSTDVSETDISGTDVSETDTAETEPAAPSGSVPVPDNNNNISEAEAFIKQKGNNSISFAKKAKEGKLLSIKEDNGIRMDWGLNGVNKKSEAASYTALSKPVKNTKAAVKNKSGVITYDEIQPGVALTYQLLGNSIKENLVLSKRDAAKSLTFSLEVNKLTPSLENNRIVIRKEDESIFRIIEAPMMVDANGEISGNLTLSMESKNKKHTVTLTPDLNWLKSDDRAYPVIVDPNIIVTLTSTNVDSTTVISSRPTSNEMYHFGTVYAGAESSTYHTGQLCADLSQSCVQPFSAQGLGAISG